MDNKYFKGSEWSIWDLHVHTPESIVEHYKGANGEEKWEAFIKDLEALPQQYKVIGINDYLFIDGYRKILEYRKNGRLKNIERIFPVIEFRIKKFAGHKEFKRINFHVIFSDELSPEIIDQQFLKQLYGKYKISSSIDWHGVITIDSLKDLGALLKKSVPKEELPQYGSDIEEGFNNINFDEEEIIDTLRKNTYLKDKVLTAIGKTEWSSLPWGDGTIAEKKDIINKVDFVFTAASSPEQAIKSKTKLKEIGVNDLLLDCSDAHWHSSNTDQNIRIGNCFTWIKADPTFEGLKQLKIEPDRIFIGDEPSLLKRVRENKTKFIKSISVSKLPDSNVEDIWFDNFNINFNSGLVAIIGNKGGGKSAITDIVSLCGNTHQEPGNFSFLTNQRFRKATPMNLSPCFEAKITWEDGDTTFKRLNENPDRSLMERVKYIPQNFLEKLCVSVDSSEFEFELKQIIFSHTPIDQRLGKGSLDELIEYKSSIIIDEIRLIGNDISKVNSVIIGMEEKLAENYIKSIEDKLKLKQNELAAHLTTIPKEPTKIEGTNQNQVLLEKIAKLRKDIEDEEKSISEAKQRKIKLTIEIQDLNKTLQYFTSLKEYIERATQEDYEYVKTLKKYEIKVSDILQYSFSFEVLSEKIKNLRAELSGIEISLNEASDTSSLRKLQELQTQLKTSQEELDRPAKEVQKYLDEKIAWDKRKILIEGSATTDDSLKYFEQLIEYIKAGLKDELEFKYKERIELVQNLFGKKLQLLEIRKVLFAPLTKFILEYKELHEKKYDVKLDVTLDEQSFSDNFFNFIAQQKRGSFYGKEEGYKKLRDLIETTDFNQQKECIAFVQNILDHLRFDKRNIDESQPVDIKSLLRKGIILQYLYDYIFNLDYLVPTYNLKLGGKKVEELSPGERGALLLIFYLLLDNDDKPLIIDQPEENLDNESVYKLLVHFIKQIKEKRQIIIVTHNPNLAVVCDADQIVHMQIEKNNKNMVAYYSGAIENKEINSRIMNILEGTLPAFNNRNSKYIR